MADKFAFLELLKESEALARGANLNDKANHAVFKVVKSLSAAEKVKSGSLYSLNITIPELIHYTKKDLVSVLNRLIVDRLICQIFTVQIKDGTNELALGQYFVALPIDERQSVVQIFQEAAFHSSKNVERWVEHIPAFSEKGIRQDLELDFKAEKPPDPSDFKNTVVDPFQIVHPGSFDIVPPPELVSETKKEILDELLRKGPLTNLVEFGLVPTRDNEIETRYEVARDYFTAVVYPRYRDKNGMKREMEAIVLEEAVYNSEEFAAQTTQFIEKKAALLKKIVTSDPARKTLRFPGMLTTDILIGMAEIVDKKYKENWKQESEKMVIEIKNSLNSGNWEKRIAFYLDSEVAAMPKEVWNALTKDIHILYCRWEQPGETIHVVTKREGDLFRQLVTNMVNLPPSRHWQILAAKTLIERNEQEFKGLFEDPNFVAEYGLMLRVAYISFMPWYHRLLITFGINWFQDSAFVIAKKKIAAIQKSRSKYNTDRSEARNAEREKAKRERLNRIKDITVSNQIVDTLDRFFMADLKVPSVEDVKKALPDLDNIQLQETISKENFQILPGTKSDKDDSILLYPMNHEWRVRSARLLRHLERIKQENPTEADRCRRLEKFLSKRETSVQIAEDPYKKLDRIIQKSKDKGDGEDLEV